MEAIGSTFSGVDASAPPLTIPNEVWDALTLTERGVFQHAARIMEVLDAHSDSTLADLGRRLKIPAAEIMAALRVLDDMDLVSVAITRTDVDVTLVALPDAHVPVVGPDGRRRWLFISRPLAAPHVDPEMLN